MQYGYPPPHAAGVPFRAAILPPSAIDVSGHKPGARIWVLIAGIAPAVVMPIAFVLFVLAIAANDEDMSPLLGIASYGVMVFASLVIYLRIGFAMFWLYQAWKWLPAQERFDRNGRPRTPGETFYLFIPYFNVYWMFVYNFALCDALERMRVRYRTTQPAPRDLVMWACICELIPLANLAAPFLWFSVMKRIDQMHEEMVAQT